MVFGKVMMLSAIRNATHLAVKIRAPPNTEANDKPINLAILLDTSGSMADDRLGAVKRTLHAARDLFKPTDQITMVTFDDKATTIADHLLMDADGLTRFYAAVDGIVADGCTNLSAGIEQLLLLRSEKPYDTILVLTDGIINGGITSVIGLHTMMAGVSSSQTPIVTLGYGADHNRILLRDLAVRSRGSYTYVDSDEILPIAMGDLIGGLRAELYNDVTLNLPAGWACCEIGDGGASFMLGSVVPDRDYWVVFQKMVDDVEVSPITLTAGMVTSIATLEHVLITDCLELKEQVLRCRVAKALVAASDAMERGQRCPAIIGELVNEFSALSEGMLYRPLVLRMRAEVAAIAHAPPTASLLARMSSGGAYLSTQRGVSSGTGSPGDPQEQLFSSPLQRTTANQVQSQYNA